MNKEFVQHEEAIALKELGFNELCLAYYQKSSVIGDDTILPLIIRKDATNWNDYSFSKLGVPFYSAPLYQQAFRWFRDKYGLYPNIMTSIESYLCGYEIWDKNNEQSIDYSDNTDDWNMTYEEAELSCLRTLIKIVKDE